MRGIIGLILLDKLDDIGCASHLLVHLLRRQAVALEVAQNGDGSRMGEARIRRVSAYNCLC